MLFCIKLQYIRTVDEVQVHLDAHKTWLAKYAGIGSILFAGPLHGEKGGFVLAYADQRAEIEKMIAQDPFHVHGLATFDIQCCEPTIRATGFPAQWAAGAVRA
ncbi:YciI family protein [Paraburkholderia phenoliruptrix]|uniref:YciI family protein n=1 Tax=Paraburkholderia phenoliruptrix TaxID=252970 RepID=A0ABV3W805_9BURK